MVEIKIGSIWVCPQCRNSSRVSSEFSRQVWTGQNSHSCMICKKTSPTEHWFGVFNTPPQPSEGAVLW